MRIKRKGIAVLLLTSCAALGACGITTQEEPRPVTSSRVAPAATPTVTQRPDPTSSAHHPSTTTAVTTPH